MKKVYLKWLWFTPLLAVLSCSNTVELKEEKTKKTVKNLTCPIIESGKWHAWLDTYKQPEGSYRLNISGEVILPNPAFDLNWEEGPTDRMSPPGLRLALKPTVQEGMAIQVMTTKAVKHEMVTPIANYRHVSIYCGGKLLGKIDDVMLTD